MTSNAQRNSPKLLDMVRMKLRGMHYANATEKNYCQWIRRFILFHDKRHPREMGKSEVEAFLTHLAVNKNVAASTQNQALAALLFLYQRVLEMKLDWVENVVRAKKPQRVPEVLWPDELAAVFQHLSGRQWLMVMQIYGGGLRLSECLRLRVKEVDFQNRQVTIRRAKGQKDRFTLLPEVLTRRVLNPGKNAHSATSKLTRSGYELSGISNRLRIPRDVGIRSLLGYSGDRERMGEPLADPPGA